MATKVEKSTGGISCCAAVPPAAWARGGACGGASCLGGGGGAGGLADVAVEVVAEVVQPFPAVVRWAVLLLVLLRT